MLNINNSQTTSSSISPPFGDSIDSLPVDETQQQPQIYDAQLLQVIFVPVSEPTYVYYLKITTFAGVIYTLLIKTPAIDDYIKKNFNSETLRHLIRLGIVVGTTYLFSKTLQ